MDAIYISSNTFTVDGDRSIEFNQGRRLKATLSSGDVFCTTSGSTYSGGTDKTAVGTYENELNATLTSVLYGVVSPGTYGSLPNHTHDGSEGSGGFLNVSGTGGGGTSGTFLDLTDTPSDYDSGKYLLSTASGTIWSDNNSTHIGLGVPIGSVGVVDDVYIDSDTGYVYEKTQPAGYTSDQTISGTASATSESAPPNDAAAAFDGTVSTCWYSQLILAYPAYIQYQFTEAVNVSKLRMYPRTGYLTRMPKDFTIKGSNTGAFSGEETDIATYTGEVYTDGWNEFEFSNPNTFTYYRIHITASDDSYQNICEIEMMGWISGWTLRVSGNGTKIFVGAETPTLNNPSTAHVGDYYIHSLTSDLYERQLLDSEELVSDNFTGTVLDTATWGNRKNPTSSITVNDILELNNGTGGAHSGAHVFNQTVIDKTDIIRLSCKWKPHADHYSTAVPPMIVFRHATSFTVDASYGHATTNCVQVRLGKDTDSTNRSQISIENVSSYTVAIDITEDTWQDLVISLDCSTREMEVILNDGDYTLSTIIDSTVFNSLGSQMRIEFTTADYEKDNTEAFDDIMVTRETSLDAWDNLGGHTHPTFSGTSMHVDGDATVTGTMYAHVYDSYSPLTIKDGGVTVISGDGAGAIDFPAGATISGSILSDGADGADGADGNVWTVTEGLPPVNAERIGDMHLDSSVFNIYQSTMISGEASYGTTDLCTGGTAAANSNQVGYGPEEAFDDNTSTYWIAYDSYPQWLGYGWSEAKIVGRMGVHHYGGGIYATVWKFQGSNSADVDWDDKAWTDLFSTTQSTPTPAAFIYYDIPNPAPYKYYRAIASAGQSTYWAVKEMEFLEYLTPSAYELVGNIKGADGEDGTTASGGGGASTFLDLTDTPTTYSGGQYLMSTASGIEYGPGPGMVESDFKAYEIVAEYELTDEVLDVTISGVAGDTDGKWLIDYNLIDTSTSNNVVRIRFNNDSASNYYIGNIAEENDAAVAAWATGYDYMFLAYAYANTAVNGHANLFLTTGTPRSVHTTMSRASTTDSNKHLLWYASTWSNTADEVSIMDIYSAGALSGSISIYKLKKVALPTGAANHIDEDLTLYLSTTGNDTTGNGTLNSPWKTLATAWDYLQGKTIHTDNNVTIKYLDGIHTISSLLDNLTHPCSSNIVISGETVLDRSITSVQSSSGSAGAYSVIFNVNSVTDIEVGDFVLVANDAANGTNYSYACGVHEVTNVDSGNTRITVTSKHRKGAPSGSVTASFKCFKTVLNCTEGFIRLTGNNVIQLKDFVAKGTTTDSGLAATNGASIICSSPIGISGFSACVSCLYGASVTFSDCGASGGNSAIVYTFSAAVLHATNAVFSGSVLSHGLLVYNNGTAHCNAVVTTGHTGNGVVSAYNSFAYVVDSTSTGNGDRGWNSWYYGGMRRTGTCTGGNNTNGDTNYSNGGWIQT